MTRRRTLQRREREGREGEVEERPRLASFVRSRKPENGRKHSQRVQEVCHRKRRTYLEGKRKEVMGRRRSESSVSQARGDFRCWPLRGRSSQLDVRKYDSKKVFCKRLLAYWIFLGRVRLRSDVHQKLIEIRGFRERGIRER